MKKEEREKMGALVEETDLWGKRLTPSQKALLPKHYDSDIPSKKGWMAFSVAKDYLEPGQPVT